MIEKVVEILKSGGVVAVPTETVFGLVADARKEEAVKRIYRIKERPESKPLTAFVKDIESLRNLGEYAHPGVENLIGRFMPGPLTIIMKAKPDVPAPIVSDEGKVGVRIPDHPVIKEILAKLDFPLASTSANISGKPPLFSFKDVKSILGDKVDYVVEEDADGKLPSTVLDVSENVPVLNRKGPVSLLDIEEILEDEIKFSEDLILDIIFLCTGNTCRSPMAAWILKNKLDEDLILNVEVVSRGTDASSGMPMNEFAVEVLKEKGYRVGPHFSQRLTESDVKAADIVYCMEKYHLDRVREISERNVARMFSPDGEEVPDPIGHQLSFYRIVREMIEHTIENHILPYVKRKFSR